MLKKRILPLTVQFSPTAKGLAIFIRRKFEKWTQGSRLGEWYRVVAAFKKGKNLKDMLVHSRLGPTNQRRWTDR